jgi:hypothetical protein
MLEPFTRPLINCYLRFLRRKTLGVRAMVIDESNRVFLVQTQLRERLVPARWWSGNRRKYFIGTCTRTRRRRQYRVDWPTAALRGVLEQAHFGARSCRTIRRARIPPRRATATQSRNHCAWFFSPDALPEDTSGATRARVAEVIEGHAVGEFW